MSLAESFLETARNILMMSENIKRLDERVDRLADDVHGVDRRLMKIEVTMELAKQPRGRRSQKELPGQ